MYLAFLERSKGSRPKKLTFLEDMSAKAINFFFFMYKKFMFLKQMI